MSIVTSQQINRYFELYQATEVTFNREVSDATGLLAKNLYLKVADQQWPCIIYGCSLRAAKVIASVRNAFFDALRKSNSHATLRLCFRQPDKKDPISFFVPSRAGGFTPYNPQNPEVQLIGLDFTNRPPGRPHHDPRHAPRSEGELEAAQGRAGHPDRGKHEKARAGVARIHRRGRRHPAALRPARPLLQRRAHPGGRDGGEPGGEAGDPAHPEGGQGRRVRPGRRRAPGRGDGRTDGHRLGRHRVHSRAAAELQDHDQRLPVDRTKAGLCPTRCTAPAASFSAGPGLTPRRSRGASASTTPG